MILFCLFGIVHPAAILQFIIFAAWVTLFLCGTGLFFSTRFKRTTSAVIANVTLAAFLWALFPLLLGLLLAITRSGDDLLEVCLDFNPFVHAYVIAEATAHRGSLHRFDWCQRSLRDLDSAMAWMVFNFILYVGVGWLFLARAWSRLRRNPV